jgi:hypothetical protein
MFGKESLLGKIKITPKMIEAGTEAYYGFDNRFDPVECGVEEIFRAMVLASLSEVTIPPSRSNPFGVVVCKRQQKSKNPG